jgi:spermidine synthase
VYADVARIIVVEIDEEVGDMAGQVGTPGMGASF